MAIHPSLIPEIGPDGLAREAPVIAYTEKIIEEEQLQVKRYIEENYSKIRDVERELANLSMELKLTAGPKKAALEHLRKKIELATERIHAAKLKEEQARKAWETATKVVKDEEEAKRKLCEDLNNLVQESSNTQFHKLEELKRKLEALNPSRVATVDQLGTSTQQIQNTMENSSVGSVPHPTSSDAQVPTSVPLETEVKGSSGNSESQSMSASTDGRGRRKPSIMGKGRGNLIASKGRGFIEPGWTGAGFDVDGRT